MDSRKKNLRQNDHRLAKAVWLLGLLAFVAPAVAGWAILSLGHYEGCIAGAAVCTKLPGLGTFLKQSLDLAWALGMSPLTLIPLALIVALAAIVARSPARAFIGVFGGPTAALLLPVLVVMSALYPGCHIEDGGSGCTFWGVAMGKSFTTASIAPWFAYTVPFVSLVAALMVMAITFIVKRQRA